MGKPVKKIVMATGWSWPESLRWVGADVDKILPADAAGPGMSKLRHEPHGSRVMGAVKGDHRRDSAYHLPISAILKEERCRSTA
jgi:hypothetical protein